MCLLNSLCFLFLCISVVSERLYEQERETRVKDHRPASYEDPIDFGEDDHVDMHRGIPVVEDDVPEWVKLTFADKFIAMGQAEFLALEENFGNNPPAVRHTGKHEYEYEYIYSDEEGFEFHPDKDTLVHHHSSSSKPSTNKITNSKQNKKNNQKHKDKEEEEDYEMNIYSDDSEEEEERSDKEEQEEEEEEEGRQYETTKEKYNKRKNDEYEHSDENENEELIKAVKAHRKVIDAQEQKKMRSKHPPISVPLNDDYTKDKIQKSVSDSISLLELNTKTSTSSPSHLKGTRRFKKPEDMSLEKLTQMKKMLKQREVSSSLLENASKRYSLSGGKVNLNPNDPRIKRIERRRELEGDLNYSSSFLEIDENENEKNINNKKEINLEKNKNEKKNLSNSSQEDDQITRNNKKKNLRNNKNFKNQKKQKLDSMDIKLPSLQRHMYSNGLPVADWEVDYVNDVLKQFGYESM